MRFKWNDGGQKYFDEIKKSVAHDTLLVYLYLNKHFYIHTYAINYQIGSVIIQEGKKISFHICKLTNLQQQYTVMKKQLLSIVETLKEFRTILLGQQSKIYTDHKQLMWNNFNTDRVLRWRLILEEYGHYIEYIQDAKNIAEDALSQLSNNRNQDIPHESAYTM